MYDCRHMISEKKVGRSLYALSLTILFLFSAGCASAPEKKEADTAKSGLSSQKMITGINTVASADSETVRISANQQLNFTSVKQYDPLGLILLFPETTFGGNLSEGAPDSKIISAITPSLSPDGKNTRLEIGLKQDLAYEVNKNGLDLEVVFGHQNEASAELPVAAQAPVGAPPEKSAPITSVDLSEPTPASSPSSTVSDTAAPAATGPPAIISRIDFSTQESGKSMIIVGTDSAAAQNMAYDIQKTADRTLRVRIYNTRLPEYRRHRPLITTRFESAVDRISPMQAANLQNVTDLIVELREMVPYRPVLEGNLLTIHFDPSAIGPRPFAAANLPDWQQVLEETAVSEEAPAVQSETEPVAKKTAYDEIFGSPKEYTGEKIALDFYKTDIKNVFKILQQVSGKNYAVDKDVNGEVTISLEKPVPWDQVLDLILEMNQLGKVEQGDIIRIATTETLKKEEAAQKEKMAAIQARMEQEKTLEPLVTEYVSISYANANSEILPHIKDVLTKDRGTMTVDARNNQIIITDTQAKIDKAREIIAEIDKVTPQVLIEARIVEINDDFSREIGVAWGASGDDIYKSGLDGQYSYNVAMNAPLLTASNEAGQGAIGFNFTRLDAWGTPIVLDAALKAMESENQGKIISSPKILTLDNKKAIIKQGQRFPYQTVDDNEVNIEFEDVDLLLEVTPHVTPDQRVSLLMKTTKNEIVGFIETGEPIVSTNEAETELLVDDGETIVIGGVVKNDTKFTETGFPILKEIPMIGWLFKTKSQNNNKQELLIFMTPRIVQLDQKNIVKAEN